MLKINPTSVGSGPSGTSILLFFGFLGFFWYLYTFDSELRRFLTDNIIHSTVYTSLFIIIAFLTLKKSYRDKPPVVLTEKEVDELVKDWVSKPFVPELTESQLLDLKAPIAERTCASKAIVQDKELIDTTTQNFLGLSYHEDIKKVAKDTVMKYGVGSCGPRGFYGTLDVHLEAEKAAATFIGTEAAVFYSSGLAMLTSVIPFLLKLNDVIVCDEAARLCIQVGNMLSKSTVHYFKHNDMNSLAECLAKADREIAQTPVRRFIIVEGVYLNSGQICKLDQVVALAKKYRFRILLDDSYALGVLGATGRGTWEHFNLPLNEIDMLVAEAGCSVASVGGFAMATWRLCDEQKFSGSGFVYSASNPTYLAASAAKSFEMIAKPEIGGVLIARLRQNIATLRQLLVDISPLVASGDSQSPIIHLKLDSNTTADRHSANVYLEQIVDHAAEEGVLLTRAKYASAQRLTPPPSIRLIVNAEHTDEQLQQISAAIRAAVAKTKSPLN